MNKYKLGDLVATREAYGDALVELGKIYPNLVVLDGEVANSTYENKFQKVFSKRFLEMFIAEQNMVSVALGLSKVGLIPFMSTFAAFLTRAFDQIRMAQYSYGFCHSERSRAKRDEVEESLNDHFRLKGSFDFAQDDREKNSPNLKIVGSHAGVSIGPDGSSQMGLEDLAMFRSILESIVFYPADAVSTQKLTHLMAKNTGLFYLRTTRAKTPVIYKNDEKFHIGGAKLHYVKSLPAGQAGQMSKIKTTTQKSKVLIIAAGITLHEALKAQKELTKESIETVVMDCYSVKPIDFDLIKQLIKSIKNIVVVEDHYPAGGLGEAVLSSLALKGNDACIETRLRNSSDAKRNEFRDPNLNHVNFIHLCVRKIPRSGTPEELLHYEEIDAEAIITAVKSFYLSSLKV